jgi:hypothetical protein
MANDIIDIIVTDNSDNVQLNVTPNLVSINVSQTSGNIIGSNYYLASTFSALPITGDLTTLYVINDTSLMYRWSGSAYTQINSSAVVAWGQITGTLSGQTDLQNALNAKAPLASPTFTGTVSGITKSMVGLSNVDNTSDVNKPISTATQTALNLKADINNPTFTGTVGGITKAMVGLGNVDNTSDVNKPISSATQTALDTKAPLASPTFTGTVSGITKSMVGLGNVDNTTDLLKPISTATQSALNLKYDASNPSGYTTNVGTVTSVGGTGTVSGLSLSGTVTTSGNLTLGGTLSLTSGNVTTALGYTPENAANKGVANGYASLDGGGLVPSTQLPSYVDDVLEFADLAAFPASGATGKIYVALDTNKIYRWSGATYIEVSPTVGTIWGGITGTLSNQTDLQNALNTKQANLSGTGFVKSTAGTISYDTATYYPYPTGDTTQYVGGDGSLIAFPVAGQSGTIVRLVRNNTGATLTKGTVIYISGATGNNPVISKAIATGDATSAQTFGLCQANIANNATGYVVVMGDLIGLDTSAFTEGQQVYLSGTVAGTFTATKQYAPIHLVYIGVITRAHPTLGQIEVKIQNGYELDEIHNVSAQSPANNDIIAFNTSNSLWEKKSISTALGFTPYNATNPNNYIALTALSSSATGLTYTNTTGIFSLTAGYVIPTTASATTWDSAYTNRITSLTTTGSSGSATLVSNVLNIPTYTLSGLGGITASFLSGTSGISYNSTTGVISTSLTQYTDALARASVSLTTTGTSGASTYNSTTGVLNIPQYQSVLTNPVTGTGTTNYVAKFTSSSAIGNSQIFDNGTSVGFGTASPSSFVHIQTSNAESLRLTRTSIGSYVFAISLANAFSIYDTTAAADRFIISSTGAATFSSSVTATKAILNGSSATSSVAFLEVFGSTTASTNNGQIRVNDSVTTSKTLSIGVDGANNLAFLQSFQDGVAYRNLILNGLGGNVGIGTASPGSTLDVNGNFRIGSGTISAPGISFRNSTNSGFYLTDDGFGALINIGIGATNVAIFKYNGNVGIGTTAPGAKLELYGNYVNQKWNDGTRTGVIALNSDGADPQFRFEASNNFVFVTGATERMRITSGGNVGIGTSSPLAFTSYTVTQVSNTAGAGFITESTTGSILGQMFSDNGYATGASLVMGSRSNHPTVFITNNTERMRITSGGNVGINSTASGNGKLQIETSTTNAIYIKQNSSGGYGFQMSAANNAGTYYFQNFMAGSTDVGSITSNGTTTNYSVTSDYRLKEDLKEIKGIEKVSEIKVYDYKWKSDNTRMDGVLAHELQEILPYAVIGEKDGERMQGVDYSKLVPVLVKAIQELSAEITILKNK